MELWWWSLSTSKKRELRYKCDALRDLVPFVQFLKREKHPETLLHGCFLCFWNYTKGTKLRNVPQFTWKNLSNSKTTLPSNFTKKKLHCRSFSTHSVKFLQNSIFTEHFQPTALEYKLWQQENEKELFLIITNIWFPCLNQITQMSLSHLNLSKPSPMVKINLLLVNKTIIQELLHRFALQINSLV